MAGDSGEVPVFTKDMERTDELKWTPLEGGLQPSCWDPIPEGWTLGANIHRARSHSLCCRSHQLSGRDLGQIPLIRELNK